jgi:hypothetical protein
MCSLHATNVSKMYYHWGVLAVQTDSRQLAKAANNNPIWRTERQDKPAKRARLDAAAPWQVRWLQESKRWSITSMNETCGGLFCSRKQHLL